LKRRFNDSDAKQLVQQLVAARAAGSRAEAERLLRPDVRYWDCLQGEVVGRERVVAALMGSQDTRFDVETLAGGEGCAVAELRVSGTAPSGPFAFVATEVYAVGDGGITSCRAYFDPADLPGRDRAARM